MTADPKVMVFAGLLLAALFVLAVVLGGTQRDDMAVPDPEDPGAIGSLEALLHRLPGLGPGRHLERGDVTDPGCGTGPDLAWQGLCTVTVPDDVGVVALQWERGGLRVALAQEGTVDQRIDLPDDLDGIDEPEDRRVTLRLFGDGGRLAMRCDFGDSCSVLLLGERD